MAHFLVIYEAGADYEEKRAPHRDTHLALAKLFASDGRLLQGGAIGDPINGSAIWFDGETDEVARDFIAADPYVTEGVIDRYTIYPWTTVVGAGATVPLVV